MSHTGLLKARGIERALTVAQRSSANIGLVLFSNLVFNLTDMATTYVAMGNGLWESNPLILAISSVLGGNLLAALLTMKLVFIGSAAAVALKGIRSENNASRNLVFFYLLASTVMFYIASVNNIFWLVVAADLS